jgi:hypothetical protein
MDYADLVRWIAEKHGYGAVECYDGDYEIPMGRRRLSRKLREELESYGFRILGEIYEGEKCYRAHVHAPGRYDPDVWGRGWDITVPEETAEAHLSWVLGKEGD